MRVTATLRIDAYYSHALLGEHAHVVADFANVPYARMNKENERYYRVWIGQGEIGV